MMKTWPGPREFKRNAVFSSGQPRKVHASFPLGTTEVQARSQSGSALGPHRRIPPPSPGAGGSSTIEVLGPDDYAIISFCFTGLGHGKGSAMALQLGDPQAGPVPSCPVYLPGTNHPADKWGREARERREERKRNVLKVDEPSWIMDGATQSQRHSLASISDGTFPLITQKKGRRGRKLVLTSGSGSSLEGYSDWRWPEALVLLDAAQFYVSLLEQGVLISRGPR